MGHERLVTLRYNKTILNQFVKAIQSLDLDDVKKLLQLPKWQEWSEKSGKNGLHYAAGINVLGDNEKEKQAFDIFQYLLKSGLDINSVQKIEEKNCFFAATPLWYAYTKGRNKKIYTYLLKQGADPNHCMFAIAWYDDVKAAELFKSYGAAIEPAHFLAAFFWQKFNVAEWFLQQGMDVNFEGEEGYTALQLAVKKNRPDLVKMLLNYGADPEQSTNKFASPRRMAEEKRQRVILELFDKKPASI